MKNTFEISVLPTKQEVNMNINVKLLDCTLRDGAYIVNSQFGTPAIRGIVNKLQDANVNIIECGWLKNDPHKEGTSFYHVPDDFLPYLSHKDNSITYTAMIDWDRYDLSYLPPYDGRSIDAIRVVFPHGRHKEGMEVARGIREKGYQIYFQAANTMAYSNEDLLDLAAAVNDLKPVSLSVVDTFGAMYEEDLERVVSVLDGALDPGIQLGFHSHNNQQLSFALTTHFIKLMQKSGRNCVVDASLCGMGRGAGNATTELVVSYLNRKCGCHYDMDAIMDAIDVYMGYFQENYNWGYSTPYFIAGMYECHVNNIAYLLKNHRTTAKDMRNIIESLDPADRRKYDYDLLEKKYLANQDHYFADDNAVAALKDAVAGRPVLLVAPGKQALSCQADIQSYIEKEHPVVIGVNAILPGYQYDYVFFVNPARYEYARETDPAAFDKFQKIILSNIKTTAGEGEAIVSFNSVIKRGWEHFDNAVICCLRLMERLGVHEVAIAGFDGFKNHYNESYADPFLPTLNPNNKWDELNEEIRSMFADFKRSTSVCRDIRFLTPSYFES